MKRAALYVRVSTDQQAEEGYSIDEQVERLQAYCKAQDWTVVGVYRDAGFSGSKLDRPGIKKLVNEANRYDVIVVYRLDRLSRSQKDTLYLIEDVFTASGCEFVSITESFDTSSSVGKMMVGILSAFAQLERERIKERMQVGRIGRAKSGKAMNWTGSQPYGYSYSDGKHYVIPREAEAVYAAHKWYLAGTSQSKIVERLQAEYPKPATSPWSKAKVQRILTNPIYIGKMRYLGTLYEGSHEAIMSDEMFARTQTEVKRRQAEAYTKGKPRPFQSKYALSGLLVCGFCGSHFTLRTNKKRKDGTAEQWYYCPSRLAKSVAGELKHVDGCESERYNRRSLEAAVFSEIEQLRLDPDALMPTRDEKEPHETKRLEKRLKAIDKAEARLVDLYVDGRLSMPALDAKRESLNSEKEELHALLEANQQEQKALSRDDVRAVFEAFPSQIKELAPEEQRQIVRALVDRIELKNDDMNIFWRF